MRTILLVTMLLMSLDEITAAGDEPIDLSRYKWKNRLLFVLAPDRSHPAFQQLHDQIARQAEGAANRDLVVFEIIGSGRSTVDNDTLSPASAHRLRQRFEVPESDFAVILVGKDGGVKLEQRTKTRLEEIFSLIDAMPMRRMEMGPSSD